MKTVDYMNRQFTPYEGMRRSLKRRNKVCKKNHNKPHVYEFTAQSTLLSSVWSRYKCMYCGKKEWSLKNRDTVLLNPPSTSVYLSSKSAPEGMATKWPPESIW